MATTTVNGVKTTHVGAERHRSHVHAARRFPATASTLFVSVPLPYNHGNDRPREHRRAAHYPKPVVVKFSFKTGGPTVYEFEL